MAMLTGVAGAQHSGDIPHALVWNKLKGNCPASLDWQNLRGKVVVVSLTADDVFPEEITEWNTVAQKFQREQVLFIQVVEGTEFLLDQALQQSASQVCILFDSDRANRKNFKLPTSIGGTVVIDPLGVIAGYSRGDPEEHSVRSVLNHQVDSGLSEVPPRLRPTKAVTAPSFGVHITPATRSDVRNYGAGPDRYTAMNWSLKQIILDLWSMPIARIVFPEKLPEGNFDVTAHIPVDNHELLTQILREAVEKQFGLRVDREQRTQRVYMLSVPGNPSSKLQPAIGEERVMSGGGQGSIIGTAQTMEDIARALEGLLNVPVVDETGLKGKYNYSALTKLPAAEAPFDLAHQLGLELTEAERPIQMLVVRKVQ
ncbi:MAG: TIGR03435 family protein [Bryobacteraceae bacterium]|jgi:uncharacterized protein (TIGR03435 family)